MNGLCNLFGRLLRVSFLPCPSRLYTVQQALWYAHSPVYPTFTASILTCSQATCAFLREVDVRGDTFFVTTLAVYFALATLDVVGTGSGIIYALTNAALILSVHLICVVAIIVLYRVSPLHPLYSFPGPLLNKITSLAHLQMVASGKRHFIIAELHEKYGTFVRIGTSPNIPIHTPFTDV